MENKATLDLAGLCGWAVEKAVKHAEEKTSLPLGELITPMAQRVIQNAGIATALEIDPMIIVMGRIVLAGMDAQKKRTQLVEEEAKKEKV